MNPVIVDTSVWIDYFKGITNSKTELVKEYLEMKYQNDYDEYLYSKYSIFRRLKPTAMK